MEAWGDCLPQDSQLTSSAEGSQLPSDPMSPLAWPLPLHMQGRLPPGAPPIPACVWNPCRYTVHHRLSAAWTVQLCARTWPPCIITSAAAAALQQASGPRGQTHAPQVSVPGGPENVLLSSKLPLIWMLLWGAYLETHCLPQHWRWLLSFSSTGGEAHHRFQLITDFSLHDLLRGKEPKKEGSKLSASVELI